MNTWIKTWVCSGRVRARWEFTLGKYPKEHISERERSLETHSKQISDDAWAEPCPSSPNSKLRSKWRSKYGRIFLTKVFPFIFTSVYCGWCFSDHCTSRTRAGANPKPVAAHPARTLPLLQAGNKFHEENDENQLSSQSQYLANTETTCQQSIIKIMNSNILWMI